MQELKESTSIKVTPSLWKKVKIESICDELEISEFVEEALKFWIIKRHEFRTKGEKCFT